ncbi:MAG: Subtilisin [Pseudomonadota bacterium]|jgi:subtilisin family serine protease
MTLRVHTRPIPSRPAFRGLLLAAVAGFALGHPGGALAQTAPRTVVESAADLPRFAYTLPVKPSVLLTDDAAFATLRAAVAKDAAAVMAGYDIKDPSARDIYRGTLRDIALLEGRYEEAAALAAAIAADREKPADRLTSGLIARAHIAAVAKGGTPAAMTEELTRLLEPMPWDVVGAAIKQTKSGLETLNPELIKGAFEAQLDRIWAGNPSMDLNAVRGIIGARVTLAIVAPRRDAILAALSTYIAKHDTATEKPDIWAARNVDFPTADGLTPVTIAVWDSGLDISLFQDRRFTNTGETANGRDDDGNGFVDDLHGIAFTRDQAPAAGDLMPLTAEQKARVPDLLGFVKGSRDSQANIDSAEARAFRQKLSTMKREEVPQFLTETGMIGLYLHGTHVAGIAMAGNPAARLMHVSMQLPFGLVPPLLDEAYAERMGTMAMQAVTYMKANNVRVANMSWRITRPMIEGSLAANNAEPDPKARAERADRIFRSLQAGLTAAFATAPEILFIAGAGNEDQDINFAGSVPAGIDLPNVITVGAVDQAGAETSFTSIGASVDFHANGFRVDSVVPGGQRMAMSGTSMAAPQVANLAGKLLAVNPSLTPAQVIALIREGADRRTDRGVSLINPKATIDRARPS